ncbi:hypothetical protein EPN96_02175 [bacterium]|nr:MAG: hypothetical protein EPN96_02175 [bacterium]
MLRRIVTAALLLLLAASVAAASFRHGPVLLGGVPENLEKPLAVADKSASMQEKLPPQIVSAAQSILASGKSVLLVGHTDSTGPKLLNRSLGLQYAVNMSHRLASALKADAFRFVCASAGESSERKDGWVELFGIVPPPEPAPPPKSAVVVLEPRPEEGAGGTVTLLKDGKVSSLLFASEGAEGITIWRALTDDVLLTYDLPARQDLLVYGGRYREQDFTGKTTFDRFLESEGLGIKIESVESGWARLSGKVPAGLSNVTVLAGPVPYPAGVENGKFEVNVALLPYALPVYVQGVDAKGKIVAGQIVELPASAEEPPDLLAILVWDGEKADLDLHGWISAGHTQPQDSDPEISSTAASGVSLLFDGDGLGRASALSAKNAERLEIEVTCFNDFGGGARALLYVYEKPGDKLKRAGMIIGPREISGEGSRWLALRP